MRLLLLGGTLFLGRHLVEAAGARGHHVTLFHRGRTNPRLFPDAEHLLGDRDGGLEALGGGRWDAVIDTSGYLPRVVRAAAERMAVAAAHYTFISSISVYAEPQPGLDESGAVATIDSDHLEGVIGESYGALKALCERVVESAFPGRALLVRPGLLVGPHDPTDRFTWWVRRIARGGEVLAPGDPGAQVQLIDARDLAAWVVAMVERGEAGVFNATGPPARLTLGRALETCREVSGSDARFTWIDEAFLLERGVQPWSELPLWVPRADAAFLQVDCRRAWSAGLRFRALEQTARDTLEWDRDTPLAGRPEKPGVSFPAGMDPEREAGLLREWHARPVSGRA